jgi:predicted RNA binding protein YcfA (HicA-like mRNA interferase family)
MMNGKAVIKILQKKGWQILRSQGSHYRLGKDSLRVTIPVHGSKDLGKGLLAAIERQTGVKLS